MTPAKLRAAAEIVLSPIGNHGAYEPGSPEATCARAALALAELMPHLEAFADEWAKPNAHAVTLHAPGFSVAVVDLLVALGKAKESLQ